MPACLAVPGQNSTSLVKNLGNSYRTKLNFLDVWKKAKLICKVCKKHNLNFRTLEISKVFAHMNIA